MLTPQQLALCHKIIDRVSSDIIGVMKAFTNDAGVYDNIVYDLNKNGEKQFNKDGKIKFNQNGKKQFNDLMEAANKASSLDELELYIAYKGAKEGTRGMWEKLSGPTIRQIKKGGELEDITLKVQKYARDKHKEDFSLDDIHDDIHMEVVRRFTGYLMWQANIMIEQDKKKEQEKINNKSRS